MFAHKKNPAPLQAPPWEIAMESSVCTGEKLIGFKNPATGRLEHAEVVRGEADISAFYRRYGLPRVP